MREQKKANRVSWASGANLFQVKYFQTADLPSKVGQQTHEDNHSYAVVVTPQISQIPQIQWDTPPEFILRSSWLVAAGEESEEVEVQRYRERGVLEAVYPRCSAIPPNPLISLDVEGKFYDDTKTPTVPIIPIEETAAVDLTSSETASSNISINLQLENLLQDLSTSLATHNLEGDPVIATVAAANAILNSKKQGSSIDTDLLVQLLQDPEKTQKLINEHHLSSITNTGTHEVTLSNSQSADAGSEALERPLTIKRPLSANATTATEFVSKSIYSSVSLVRSTNELLIKSPSHQSNQLDQGAVDIAARQEQLQAGRPKTRTGSRSKQVRLSVSRTGLTSDLPSKKTTRSQPVNNKSQSVTKHVSPAANPKIGSCSHSKEVVQSIPLLSSPAELSSKKSTNEHGQLANIGSVATLKPLEGGSASASKIDLPSVSLPISVHDLPGRISTHKHNQLANTGDVVGSKPVATQSVAADTGLGTRFIMKAGTESVSLAISVHDCPGKRSRSEHNQQVNTENFVVPKPVLTQSVIVNVGTGSGLPVSLPISVHGLPGKNSTSEHNQQVNTGNMVISKPVVTQAVAASAGSGTGYGVKTVSSPVGSPFLVHDLPPEKKSTKEHDQQVAVGNLVVSKPVVTENTGGGMRFRVNMATPQASSLTPCPEILGGGSINEQYQPARMENVAVSRPLMQSVSTNFTNGTGFRPLAATTSVPFPNLIPDFWSKKTANEPYQLANAVAGLVAEKQSLSIPRINAELPGAPTNFGPFPVANPVQLTGPNLDISRLKKLIHEHGAHFQGGSAPAAGTNPSRRHMQPQQLLLAALSACPYSAPGTNPSREHMQAQQLLLAALSACPYSAPATPPQVKDMQHQSFINQLNGDLELLKQNKPRNYYQGSDTIEDTCQAFINQLNGHHELFQQNKPRNYYQGSEAAENAQVMESEQKIEKPCLFYNTAKGCRNGSRCRFQHDVYKQWRSGDDLEPPNVKRMKPGTELTGFT